MPQSQPQLRPRLRPVIAIAGLGIESSTFSPARTEAPAFHPRRGRRSSTATRS